MKRFSALFMLLVAGIAIYFLFQAHQRRHSADIEMSTIRMVNDLFEAVAAQDQTTVNRLMKSEDDLVREASGDNEFHADVSVAPPSSSSNISVDQFGGQGSRRSVKWLSTLFSGLQQPASYAFIDDPYYHELILNFDCESRDNKTCIKHLYFFLSYDKRLVIDSFTPYANTAEWDSLWNSVNKQHTVFRPATNGQFALPLKHTK